jgi:phospholipid/cholesterol/gamma-HCH transport system substrate-binding protein
MKLSTEAKVGSVSVIALVLLAYMIVSLGSFTFGDKGYQVQAVFDQVSGLKPGNILRYAGVDVGLIKEIVVLPDGVRVTFLVKPGVKIPVGSVFQIGSDGMVGEKHVNISPPSKILGFLAPNDIVRGEGAQGFDQLVVSSDQVMKEAQQLIKSLNEILGDDKVKAAMKETIINAKELTSNLNIMSAALARMAQNNEGNMNDMIGNLSNMAATLQNVAIRVDRMMAGVDNNGQTVQDLRETIQNIKNTSARIEKMAAAMDGVITDPETAKNIKDILRNARSASEKADKMLTKVGSIDAKGGVEMLYNNTTGKYSNNVDLRIQTAPRDFAIVGINNIGDGSRGNFQIGKGNDQFAGRVGLIDSKVGMGIDTKISNNVKFSIDAYDPNDFRVKLRTQYQVAPDTFIVGQADNVNRSSEKSTYIGVRRTF